jgi:hypothetical protein
MLERGVHVVGEETGYGEAAAFVVAYLKVSISGFTYPR